MGKDNYISINDIRKKAVGKYFSILKTWLKGEECFPLDLTGSSIGQGVPYRKRLENFKELSQGEKKGSSPGYEMVMISRNTRNEGPQSFLKTIRFTSMEDYLYFLGKKEEFSQMQEMVEMIIKEVPALNLWVRDNPKKIIDRINDWPNLIKVIGYFLQNESIDLSFREISLTIPTKFIENNQSLLRELLDSVLPEERIISEEKDLALRYGLKKEDDFRFRILLPENLNTLGPFRDLSVLPSELSRWNPDVEYVILIENKYAFLQFPDLDGWLKIWGSGNSVVLLEQCRWLNEKKLYYWGDMDPQGFDILHMFRTRFPETRSLFMNMDCYNQFKEYAHSAGNYNIRENLHLTDEEKECYQYLISNSSISRIEQERISLDWINTYLEHLIDDHF
ncbi:MAG: hypothetical protein JEY91_03705 [Spirochaetaceae bacterium]|nr:hypothetical protein [Spirochaetaceae bacterium]